MLAEILVEINQQINHVLGQTPPPQKKLICLNLLTQKFSFSNSDKFVPV